MFRLLAILILAVLALGVRAQDAMHYRNFALRDSSGVVHQLSDYVEANRAVLVEFWASWCAPCRNVSRNLGSVYSNLKSKGLEIVGVSLDTKRDEWVEALRASGVPWTQLSDLRGWQSSAAREYGVEYIPYCVLIVRDGSVIASGLFDEIFSSKLESVLRSE